MDNLGPIARLEIKRHFKFGKRVSFVLLKTFASLRSAQNDIFIMDLLNLPSLLHQASSRDQRT